MKHRTSVSNNAEIIRELRDDPEFAAQYMNAALKDTQEPAVLLMALRHLSEARASLRDTPLPLSR